MFYKYLQKLEYDKILDKLVSFSVTFLGKELGNNLEPTNSFSDVKKLLLETNVASVFIYRKGNLPISPIADISLSLKSLESSIRFIYKKFIRYFSYTYFM